MDESLLLGLRCSEDPSSQSKTLQYFEELKNSPEGWKICGDALIRGIYSDDNVKFFCFQVLEHHIRTRHIASEPSAQQALRKLLMTWFHNQCSGEKDKSFIRNKAAQAFALTFVTDYPHQWLSFFSDLHQTLGSGPVAVDLYLRILKAIDEVVVNREVARTPQEADRNTMIKDFMREHCIPEIVDSWFGILKTYERTDPSLTCLCLEVVGIYVAWIDINLIANENFISVLLHLIMVDVLRESVCDCFHEIISKGMDPVAKTDLVESLVTVLDSAGVLTPSEDMDNDFLAKLAKLANCIGIQLVNSYNKLLKSNDEAAANKTLQAIDNKLRLLYRFLGDEDDDISHTINGFAYSYLLLLKQASSLNPQQKHSIEVILYTVIKKMKYDESYNFAREDEDEVMFMEFRKEMKVLFDNVAQLDPNLVLLVVHNVLNSTLERLQEAEFMDVEMAVRLVFMLGEAIPAQQLYSDSSRFSALQQMLSAIVSSRISYYQHSAVSLMYFETVVRYERFFHSNPESIPTVLIAFLDERGLRNANSTVRSRCCYLLSRFIKSHKNQMHNYVDDVLKRLQSLLVTASDNGYQHLLSADEQLFLYECAGMLIASSGSSQENKLLYMDNLLSPVINKFDMALTKLMSELDEPSSLPCAQLLYNLVSFTSRTSKAFTSQQSLSQSGCAPCYKNALPVFLRALTAPVHQDIIHNGVRQYLHRMVVCLGEDVLPFIPVAVTHLLKDCSARDIQDFIPLINQIIAKFKSQIAPFLCEVFMAIVNTILAVLNKPVEAADTQAAKEKETLRRSYFLFISAIVNNDVAEVLTNQEPQNVHQVLLTIIQGAVDYPDPVAQKLCFNVLRKLVDLWGGNSVESGFKDFMYDNIVPACFLAPMKPTFNMEDAQTFLAMQEIAHTQKAILQKQGNEFVNYLQIKYLPSLNLSPSLVQEYTQALQHADMKTFKNYSKAFFTQLQT